MKTSEKELKESVSDNRLIGLWQLIQGYRLLYLAATLGVGLAALSQTGIYYLLRYFVDNVLGSDNLRQIVPWIALGFVALAVFQGAFTYLGGRLAAQTAESITRQLRNYLYDHLQRLTFTYHDKMQTGELLQRATSDVDALRRFFAEQAIGAGRIIMLFIINFTALLLLNSRLALLSVVVIPVVLVISLFFFKKVGEAYEAYQEQDAKLSNKLQENLTGVRVVKAFARQSYESEQFEIRNYEKLSRGRRLIFMHGLYWPVTDIMLGMQMLFGFYTGAQMAAAGEITVGSYLAYMGLVVQIIWPIRNLGRLITQMSTGMVSYGRIMEIVRQDREPLDDASIYPEHPPKGHIVFDNVHFQYDGEEKKVLQAINFEVQPGQVVALLGGTGSGKSSLVNLLPRFYDYDSGSITLDGVELKDYARRYLRQHIGIVMQEPFLFSRTIRENITYGVSREVSEEEVIAAAKAAAAHEFITSFPKGYDTEVGERGVTLSGGQKQRITIARTLLKNPRILILDDATSSVDTETEGEIREALQRLMQDRTTFVIAHRIQSVMTADLVLVLDHGRIVQRGTHDELVAQDGIYRRVYELQARIEADLEAELAMTGQEVAAGIS